MLLNASRGTLNFKSGSLALGLGGWISRNDAF